MPKQFERVEIIHTDGDVFEGYVHSTTKKHLTIQEKFTGVYRTFFYENIKEITVIERG